MNKQTLIQFRINNNVLLQTWTIVFFLPEKFPLFVWQFLSDILQNQPPLNLVKEDLF